MKKITLNYYDGNDGKGCEYDIYENGEVTIYFMLNGIEITDVDVDLETLGCSSVEQLVVDLLNFGYKLLKGDGIMKKKISLTCYDGSEGSEYDIYNDGEVSVYVISNGQLESEVDVDFKALGFSTVEQLVVDLLNSGYKLNL